MTIDYLKEKKELVSVVLLCVSAVLAVSILVTVTGFFTASARAEKIVTDAITQNAEEANDIDKYFTKYKILADALKKNNLFAPPLAKQHPITEVAGIFGDEVIIGDKLYKVGAKVGEATIVSIEAMQVTIEWDGKKKTFSPMDAKSSSQQGSSRASARGKSARPTGGSAQMVSVGSDGFKGKGGKSQNKSDAKMQAKRDKLDKENLKAIEKRWSTLPEPVRQKLTEIKKRWPTMSEGERDKIRTGLSERFGGGKR